MTILLKSVLHHSNVCKGGEGGFKKVRLMTGKVTTKPNSKHYRNWSIIWLVSNLTIYYYFILYYIIHSISKKRYLWKDFSKSQNGITAQGMRHNIHIYISFTYNIRYI